MIPAPSSALERLVKAWWFAWRRRILRRNLCGRFFSHFVIRLSRKKSLQISRAVF
jgi:hypothetical protein